MYNKRMYIYIMFMYIYIYHTQYVQMYVHNIRSKDHQCSARSPKTLFFSSRKTMPFSKHSKLAVWEACAREVGHGLSTNGKEQQYPQYPKGIQKKTFFGASQHNSACFVPSMILRLPWKIDPETNLRKNKWRRRRRRSQTRRCFCYTLEN